MMLYGYVYEYRTLPFPHKESNTCINSLAPGKFEWNFRQVIFQCILVIDGWGISCEIALIGMSLDFTDDESTLVQVMAWCRQATSHYLSQCWPRSMSSNDVTRPQWVNNFPLSPHKSTFHQDHLIMTSVMLCSLLYLGWSLKRLQQSWWETTWNSNWGAANWKQSNCSEICNKCLTTHLLSIEHADWPKLHDIFKACDVNTSQFQMGEIRLESVPWICSSSKLFMMLLLV